MYIFPAIDLFEGKVVRLLRGDYTQMTVYSDDPAAYAASFAKCGAKYLHLVDLQGAKDGTTPNFDIVETIAKQVPMRVEIGGGIRDVDTAQRYLQAGVWRVILGTAAVENPDLVHILSQRYGSEHVAVGVDVKDGVVAVNGWQTLSGRTCMDFCEEMVQRGAGGIICTDISRDGAMQGTNRTLYQTMRTCFPHIDLVASGGVSTLADISALRKMGLFGAIVGKALYTGDIELKAAIAAAQEDTGDQI